MKLWMTISAMALSAGLMWSLSTQAVAIQAAPKSDAPARVQVVFSGGHETVGSDRGRPVILIAAALGVPEEVFREAFTHVHPATNGHGPTDAEARANKKALMDALAPYGVTDQRLNEASNYYRYQRDQGELWPTVPAVAYAVVRNGKITGFEIEKGGSGYSSPPQISVPGITGTPVARLSFSKEFENNGAISAIEIPKADDK